MFKIAGVYHSKPILPVGAKIKFPNEKQRYTVRASNAAYTIVTKPFNAQKTVLYSILDFHEGVRGPEDLVLGMGAETDEQIAEMMIRLTNRGSEISHRHRVTLVIESIEYPDGSIDKETL